MGRIPYWTVVLPYEIGKLLAEDFITETGRMLLSNDSSVSIRGYYRRILPRR